MYAVPIVEAKNKLTFLLRILEQNETNGIEITRHGKPVAVLGKKSDFVISEEKNPFFEAYKSFRKKIENQFSEAEWENCCNISRPVVSLRHPEDFE